MKSGHLFILPPYHHGHHGHTTHHRSQERDTVPRSHNSSSPAPAQIMEAVAKPSALRVVAISGSLRKNSWHRGLLRAAEELCAESIPGLLVEHVDISGLPMCNPDLETHGGYGFPPAVEAFRDCVRAADCFLFASPEYNYSITGSLKNALDWASRGGNCWADRAAAIVTAGGSFGGTRGALHLRQIGVFLDIHFINKPELFVKAFEEPAKFDDDGDLIDAETRERLREVLLSLQAFALRLHKKD